MRRKTLRIPLVLVCITALTRVAFRSHYLYDIDSVNFALGMGRFDPVSHQPHPPGYFLYVMLARAFDALFHDANASLVAISILFSCAGLLAVWILAENWFGSPAANSAGLIFVCSPLVWFHGIVALTYASEAFFSAMAGYLCWRIFRGSRACVVPLALTAALAAGFRPSFLLFLGPLILLSVWRAGVRYSFLFTAVFSSALLAWFVPMILLSGGLSSWFSALLSLWQTVPGQQTLNSPVAVTVARVVSMGGIFLLCFGCAVPLAFGLSRVDQGHGPDKKRFTVVWIGPGLLFFTLVFLKLVNSGYLLVISPPVFAWFGQIWNSAGPRRQGVRLALTAMFVAVNSLVFLFAPIYCSYASVRRFEADLESTTRAVARAVSPVDTIIVGFDSHFLGYRHAGYYLPDWTTVQYPPVRVASGTRIFSMRNGDTELIPEVRVRCFTRFIFFPLPGDDSEYASYMARIKGHFPAGALKTVRSEGRELTTGDIKDLPRLFPPVRTPQKTSGNR